MSIDSHPFGGVSLTGEDAATFMSEMAFSNVASSYLADMARRVEPEEWVAPINIVNRLRSMKRARDWFEVYMADKRTAAVVRKVRAIRNPRARCGRGEE